jgi:hypothetical protein
MYERTDTRGKNARKNKTSILKNPSYISGVHILAVNHTVHVPDSKSRNIPEVVLVGRWAAGVLGIWKGGTVG